MSTLKEDLRNDIAYMIDNVPDVGHTGDIKDYTMYELDSRVDELHDCIEKLWRIVEHVQAAVSIY